MALDAAESPPRLRARARYDNAALLERHFRSRDPRDREELVERFLPLAAHLSRKYFSSGEADDLMQVASLALLKAIDRFDPTRGVAFTSFAVPTIVGELKRYFRDQGWSVRVPRSLKELSAAAAQADEELRRRYGRAPMISEVAEQCGSTPELVMEARMLATAHRAVSLDTPFDDELRSRVETIGADDDHYARVEQGADLDQLLTTLPERERTIVRLRYYDDLTQREIADRVGLSQMHVSRLIRTALAELGERV